MMCLDCGVLSKEIDRLRALVQSQSDVYADERETTASEFDRLGERLRLASNARIEAERVVADFRTQLHLATDLRAQLRAWQAALEAALARSDSEVAIVARAIVETKLEKPGAI